MLTLPFDLMRYSYRKLRHNFKIYETEEKIIADAQKFWNNHSDQRLDQFTHSRGAGYFNDDNRWLFIGKQSLEIYQALVKTTGYTKPIESMVEWGCGGGANAVYFADLVNKFYGVDISNSALEACKIQLNQKGFTNYDTIEIDAATPEKALESIPHPVDLFICLYVMEILPSKAYAERILQIASEMLNKGGIAFLQFKYTTSKWDTQPKYWNYASDPANMTTFWIDEFWQICQKHNLAPKAMQLITPQDINSLSPGRRYGYVLCVKQ
jgi:cyclopropane fatty-acyl-phospholipid synthase-like methyltransferase